MTQDIIRYDVLCQEALRGVVKKIVAEVVRTGLPGQHHFFITFDTKHPSVRMSARLRQRYPEEMTVVLQHQFWDLSVTDQAFEVGLSFSGIPERLLVPFDAIKGFFDPSVQFGLQFEVVRGEDTGEPEDAVFGSEADSPTLTLPAKAASPAPQRASGLRAVEPVPATADLGGGDVAEPAERKAKPNLRAVPSTEDQDTASPGATVVSLDTFRKKP